VPPSSPAPPSSPVSGGSGRRIPPPLPPHTNPAKRHQRKVVAAPASVHGPSLVQPPTPAGDVPAADRPALQSASTVGLPSAPQLLSKVAGNGD
jgi:hypothetical protein